jgi:TetR/AcrR family transcriptional regulator, cholesterol catabolism regulator
MAVKPKRSATSLASEADLRPIILHAAASLFREHGYSAASLRDIAAKVGIKAGSIYYHFASKELIAIEVMKEGIRVVSVAVERALAALPASAGPLDKLETAMRTHLSALLEESVFTSAHIRIYGFVPPEVRAEAQKVRETYDVRWRQLVAAVADSSLLRDGVDPAAMRLAILGALNWSLEWYRSGRASPADISACWFDLFMHGAVKNSPRPQDQAASPALSKTRSVKERRLKQ